MFYEKRDFFRMPVDIPAKMLSIPDDPAQKPKFFRGIIRDLSGGGLRIEANLPVVEKNKFKLSFALPFNERDLVLQEFFLSAEVIRLNKSFRKDLFEYGLKFVNISQNVQDRIIKFLFDLQISSKMEIKIK